MENLELDFINNQIILVHDFQQVDSFLNHPIAKLKLRRYISGTGNRCILFKPELTYHDYKKMIEILREIAVKLQLHLDISNRLNEFINGKEFHIESKYRVGNDIKKRDGRFHQSFAQFSELVNNAMVRQLRDKQMWDAYFMAVMGKSSNFSVPGSGKTSSVLGMYAYLKHKQAVDRIVTIGPKNAFGSWLDEFESCFAGKEELRPLNIHDSSYRSRKDRVFALKFDSGNKNLILVNYESVKTYREELIDLIDDRTLLVYDEVHKVKGVGGEYAKYALEVSKNALYIVTLTGTPIPNSYSDIYNNLQILYADEYREFFGFSSQLLKNPNEAEIRTINDKIRPFFCRTSKDDLGVPQANPDEMIQVDATEAEDRLFKILINKYKKNKFAMLIRILQLESNPKLLLKSLDLDQFKYILDDDSEDVNGIDYVDYSSEIVSLVESIDHTSKMVACIEQIQDLVNQNKTVIVWCIFIDSMRRMEEQLTKLGIHAKIINGAVELEDRTAIINGFKQNEFSVLITNPHTLAESVSLHSVCHDAIYFEYSYNLVHLLQSKDRIHRLGLSDDQYTQYYFLQMVNQWKEEPFSLDVEIYNRLKHKEQIMLEAINNNILEHVESSAIDLELIFQKLI